MTNQETRSLFQCPGCCLGTHEVGQLVRDDDVFCIGCLEEEGIPVKLLRWEESPDDQARLREPPLSA